MQTSLLKRINNLKRIRALFRWHRKRNTTGVPKFFQDIDPNDNQWITSPHSMLPLFHQIMMSIQDPSTRMDILHDLNEMTHMDISQVDFERSRLQFKIFKGITGYHYFSPRKSDAATARGTQERNLFLLIYSGIRAYETVPLEKRKQFNRGITPDVKKRKSAVSCRL